MPRAAGSGERLSGGGPDNNTSKRKHVQTDISGESAMFAVVRTGGKQYKVAAGDLIQVERLDHEAGAEVRLDDVLMTGGGDAPVRIGTPRLDGVAVSAEVVEQTRGDKIVVFKKRRRQNYRRKAGHRQDLTVLRITAIGDADPADSDPTPEGDAPAPAAAAVADEAAGATEAETPAADPTVDQAAETPADKETGNGA